MRSLARARPVGLRVGLDIRRVQHDRIGLRLGLGASRGTKTCAGRPGSQGFESLDAKTWASWGVDYVKYDGCSADDTDAVKRKARGAAEHENVTGT